jgi:hypothetical protein
VKSAGAEIIWRPEGKTFIALAPDVAVDTVTELLVPVMPATAVSVAVTVWFPAELSVAEKVPVPLVSVELEGKCAAGSVLVKCTVPLYWLAVTPKPVSAVTVIATLWPVTAVLGADIEK